MLANRNPAELQGDGGDVRGRAELLVLIEGFRSVHVKPAGDRERWMGGAGREPQVL